MTGKDDESSAGRECIVQRLEMAVQITENGCELGRGRWRVNYNLRWDGRRI